MPRFARLLCLSLALSTAACGGAPRGHGAASPGQVTGERTKFPSRTDLDQLSAAPVPSRLFDDSGKDVPRWDLVGPLPDAIDLALHQDSSPWRALLDEAAAARPGVVLATEAMDCVARQYAAFFVENSLIPAEPLRRFIAARCGATSSQNAAIVSGVEGDSKIPEDRVINELRGPTRQALAKFLRPGSLDAGIAYGRKGRHAIVVAVAAPPSVRVDKTPLIPGPDGKITIRGELLQAASSVRGLINQGRHGYARCTPDLSVQLPRFAITCATFREDEAAWLEIAAFQPGRIIGETVVETLVWPAGSPGKTYAKLGLAKEQGTAPAPDVNALAQGINQARKEAGLLPLTLAEDESRTAARLAPYYFAAAAGAATDDVADKVVMGLRAGWEIPGTVRYGTFVSTWVQESSDYAEVLRATLARPFGRESLLDPAVEQIAIGTVTKERTLGAVFATYALFDRYTHDKDPATVFARLGALRAARKATPPGALTELEVDAKRAALLVQKGQISAKEALDALLAKASNLLGRDVRGWAIETTSLDEMPLPEPLLASPSLSVAFGVAHHRREGEPWGRFIVLCVAADDPKPMTARAVGPTGAF